MTFAAAQAAQKFNACAASLCRKFAAAQAAQKLTVFSVSCGLEFAAAQAAQKLGQERPGPQSQVRCRAGSSETRGGR